MNIKSLLLGSAVATVAFSGAQAADAIFVPAAEPMEYVRVCDVYGAGFYYIPGTETCLKIGGYARYEIQFEEGDDGWDKFARAQLTFDARSETEYGTLRSFIEVWFNQDSGGTYYKGENWSPSAASTGLNLRNAYIELGGFYMGLKTSLWDGSLSGEYDNFGYDSKIHTIGYNFNAGNGMTFSVGVEEFDNKVDYTPNVVGKFGIKQGWGSATLFAAYDATYEEWNVKGTAAIKLTDPLTLELAAAYASGQNLYAPALDGDTYEWALGGHLKYQATDKLALGFGGQYYGNMHYSLNDNDDWAVGAVVDYKIVKGFDSKLALSYIDGDSYGDGYFKGFARFTRSF